MKFFRVPIGIAILIGLTIFPLAGEKAAAGYLLGLGASAFNLVALWLGIKMFANIYTAKNPGLRETIFVVLMCFVKMPAFIGAGILCWKLGNPAPAAYLGGVGLVYSLMIWWAFRGR